jgi:hypothetical protein
MKITGGTYDIGIGLYVTENAQVSPQLYFSSVSSVNNLYSVLLINPNNSFSVSGIVTNQAENVFQTIEGVTNVPTTPLVLPGNPEYQALASTTDGTNKAYVLVGMMSSENLQTVINTNTTPTLSTTIPLEPSSDIRFLQLIPGT